MQQDKYATTLKHDNKIHGRDSLMMLEKRLNTELWLIHSLTGSNKHGKNAYDKQISDLVKLTLVWNFRSGSPLWSMKTTCYRA